MFNSEYLKSYWKESLFALFILIGIFKVRSEEELFWFVMIILIIHFILLQLKLARGIHGAVLENNVAAVEKYLEKGIDVDLKDSYGMTPLYLAACRNLPDMVELLIKRGANVNYLEAQKRSTIIFAAVVRKHDNIVNILITNGAVLDLHSAAFLGNNQIIKEYLEKNEKIDLIDYRKRTLLHIAAWNNQFDTAKLLLEAGAEVDALDNHSRTPLHFAASNQNADQLVKFLIDSGANLNCIAKTGLVSDEDNQSRSGTALHIAAGRNYIKIAEVLISQGANINAYDGSGDTPLHDAARIGNLDVAELLINNGADVNACDKFQGETPLHKAASRGHTNIAELLILNGAKVNFRDFSGFTPLSSAETGRHSEMYSLLVRYGATL